MLGGRQDSNRSGSGYNSTSAYDADSSDDGDDDFSYGRLSSVTHNSNNNLSSNNGRSQLLSDLYDTIERPLQPTRLSASAVSPHHHRSPHHRQELSDHMESFPMSIPHDSSVIVTPQRNHNNNTVFDDGRYGAVSSDSSDSRAPRQVGKLVQHFEGIKPVSHPSPSRPLSTMQTTIASTTRATWASVNNSSSLAPGLQLTESAPARVTSTTMFHTEVQSFQSRMNSPKQYCSSLVTSSGSTSPAIVADSSFSTSTCTPPSMRSVHSLRTTSSSPNTPPVSNGDDDADDDESRLHYQSAENVQQPQEQQQQQQAQQLAPLQPRHEAFYPNQDNYEKQRLKEMNFSSTSLTFDSFNRRHQEKEEVRRHRIHHQQSHNQPSIWREFSKRSSDRNKQQSQSLHVETIVIPKSNRSLGRNSTMERTGSASSNTSTASPFTSLSFSSVLEVEQKEEKEEAKDVKPATSTFIYKLDNGNLKKTEQPQQRQQRQFSRQEEEVTNSSVSKAAVSVSRSMSFKLPSSSSSSSASSSSYIVGNNSKSDNISYTGFTDDSNTSLKRQSSVRKVIRHSASTSQLRRTDSTSSAAAAPSSSLSFRNNAVGLFVGGAVEEEDRPLPLPPTVPEVEEEDSYLDMGPLENRLGYSNQQRPHAANASVIGKSVAGMPERTPSLAHRITFDHESTVESNPPLPPHQLELAFRHHFHQHEEQSHSPVDPQKDEFQVDGDELRIPNYKRDSSTMLRQQFPTLTHQLDAHLYELNSSITKIKESQAHRLQAITASSSQKSAPENHFERVEYGDNNFHQVHKYSQHSQSIQHYHYQHHERAVFVGENDFDIPPFQNKTSILQQSHAVHHHQGFQIQQAPIIPDNSYGSHFYESTASSGVIGNNLLHISSTPRSPRPLYHRRSDDTQRNRSSFIALDCSGVSVFGGNNNSDDYPKRWSVEDTRTLERKLTNRRQQQQLAEIEMHNMTPVVPNKKVGKMRMLKKKISQHFGFGNGGGVHRRDPNYLKIKQQQQQQNQKLEEQKTKQHVSSSKVVAESAKYTVPEFHNPVPVVEGVMVNGPMMAKQAVPPRMSAPSSNLPTYPSSGNSDVEGVEESSRNALSLRRDGTLQEVQVQEQLLRTTPSPVRNAGKGLLYRPFHQQSSPPSRTPPSSNHVAASPPQQQKHHHLLRQLERPSSPPHIMNRNAIGTVSKIRFGEEEEAALLEHTGRGVREVSLNPVPSHHIQHHHHHYETSHMHRSSHYYQHHQQEQQQQHSQHQIQIQDKIDERDLPPPPPSKTDLLPPRPSPPPSQQQRTPPAAASSSLTITTNDDDQSQVLSYYRATFAQPKHNNNNDNNRSSKQYHHDQNAVNSASSHNNNSRSGMYNKYDNQHPYSHQQQQQQHRRKEEEDDYYYSSWGLSSKPASSLSSSRNGGGLGLNELSQDLNSLSFDDIIRKYKS